MSSPVSSQHRFDTRAPIPDRNSVQEGHHPECKPDSSVQHLPHPPWCSPPEVNLPPLLAGPWAAWGKGADLR